MSSRRPDIFMPHRERAEREERKRIPDVDIRPWHQRWFGWVFPSTKTFEVAGEFGSNFTALLVTLTIVTVIVGAFGYGVGWILAPYLDMDPHKCGMVSAILMALTADVSVSR